MVTGRAGDEILSAVLAAVVDPTRRTVFERLVTSGPTTATVLSGELGITRQAVAKHLAQLADCELAERNRVGRETLYSARPERLEPVTAWTKRTNELWNRRLGRLADVVGGHHEGRNSPPG